MPGPVPKDPAVRRRRNKASTHAVLEQPSEEREPPPLPNSLFDGRPKKLTVDWWRTIWQSPMAARWLDSDIEGLYVLAALRDEFYRKRTPTLAAEIRQQEARFGLDVMARRRLDWRIGGAPVTPEEPDAPRPAEDETDYRGLLRAVK